MFYGSVPKNVQMITADIIKNWNCKDVYIECSGNFAIEKTLSQFHSNDVTLYSYFLGQYLSGNPIKLELSNYGLSEIYWVKNHIKTPTIKQFGELHSQTVNTIEKSELSIADYYNGDAMYFVDNAPTDSGFITYPPFKNAGNAYITDFTGFLISF